MKAVILALSIVGVAATAPLNAQIVGTRLPTPSTSRGTSVNGSWQVVGQDRNGNTIYERRTYDGNGNIVVQRARRDAYGNFSIIDTRTVRNDNNRNCQYANNGTVGDIILGRNGTTGRNGTIDCRNDRRSVDGVWRQVGRGRNNNSVYERRTLDANGNVVVQKARRNPDGSFTILSTRTVRDNRGVRNRNGDDDDDRRFDRGRGGDDDERFDRRGDHDDDEDRFDRSDDGNGGRFSGSEHGRHGRGKGHKGRD
jgi:hypothetical protein